MILINLSHTKTVSEIASLTGYARWTVYKRRKELEALGLWHTVKTECGRLRHFVDVRAVLIIGKKSDNAPENKDGQPHRTGE